MIASPTCFRLLLLVAILGSRSLFGQSTGKNFVLERTYKGPRTAVSGNVRDAVQQVSYFDGLGRPLQSINAQASPLLTGSRPADLVSHTEYDAAGRVSKVYAPYPQAYQAASAFGNGRYVNADSAVAKSVAFYNTTANFDQNNNRGYTLTEYEASPLSRVTKQFSVGSDRAVTTSYGSNAASEVNRYDVSGDNPVRNGYYGAGQLVKTSVTDENGNVSVEFKDKSGLTLLRSVQASSSTWLNTYYVYDDLSQLRFVLQPEYQNEGSVSKYAFKYTYNDRGLVSSKYVPGGGTTEMWYDNRDRLIESKDGNGKYTYFKYDELNRVIETGEKAGTTYRALVKTHYDTYSPPFSGVQTFVSGYGNGYPAARSMNVNGQVTVTAARVLNPNGEYDDAKDVWLCTTIYYDDRFNVIQTIRNLFDLGGNNNNYEYVVKQIRFDGRVEKELIEQKVSTGEHFVEKQYTYDHADRLLSVRYVVKKDGAEKKNIVVSASRYDALGQLKKKFLHSADSRSFREQLDYSYVPRSWMSKVTGKTGAGENFGIELKYANATTPQYNGNIGEMLWRQAGSATWPGYKFTYDGANRLSKGEGSGYDYSETVSLYDLNGNIRKLQRKKLTATWDDLTYTYLDGNRLTKVTDAGTAEGFNNGASADSTDYNYDGNGNMTRDKNRGIADGGIRYNILNLPREVAINNLTMKYHYDAAGTKVRMERGTENTKYAGFFEYNSSNYLTRIGIEEGQITITNNGAGINDYSVDYYLKDHLGNVRQVINEAGMLLQETEYFPFGLAIPRTAGTNKYLYNGKEKQPETGWLDYGARMYDPTVGRWMAVDPLSEKSRRWSPYNYGEDDPMGKVDPDGMEAGPGGQVIGNPKILVAEGFRQYLQAAGSFIDRFFVSSQTAGDTKISDAKTGGSEVLKVASSVNVTYTTTVSTNLAGLMKMNSENKPKGPLLNVTNTMVTSQQTEVEGSATIRGADVKVTNTTNISSDKVSNTTEFSVGKTITVNDKLSAGAAAYISQERTSSRGTLSSQTDIGLKASVTYTPTTATNPTYNRAAGSTVTQTFKIGFIVDKR
ncbi:RHS repeat-associated core domain-containing protein [Siphonobacter aquaeclarae]|uniref:RHS repeat-associated core domain-containing protein n=1 Tax=Siphonobacter aquaeclarae TaxID=563176 RepID=A0A1G9T7T6_9BACT|nr:RHS repeat-associated core domain-containing protein [Siphonobacter aquaeclarae]